MNKSKLKRIMKERGCSMIEARDLYSDFPIIDFGKAANEDHFYPERFSSIRYTFEYYDDKMETRGWFTRFIAEHNDKKVMNEMGMTAHSSATRVVTDNISKFIRIRHDGKIIGYARVHDARKVVTISDVYVLHKYRKQGHYHRMFPNLAKFCDAQRVCLTEEKYDEYSDFYHNCGFKFCLRLVHNPGLVHVATRKAVAMGEANGTVNMNTNI